MNEWQKIETAPRDGTVFLISRLGEGQQDYEVGWYEPGFYDKYTEVEHGLYRKESVQGYEWCGFNNFHRATHWMPLPEPPK